MSKKLKPGQPGTKRLVTLYGARLLSVRDRYDAAQGKRYKTVELIVEEAPWQSPVQRLAAAEIVGLRIGFKEVALQRRVKAAGGKWNPNHKL